MTRQLFDARRAAERQPDPYDDCLGVHVQANAQRHGKRPPRDRDAGMTDAQVIARDWFGEREA